jgi:hypothetical protein
MTNTDTLKALEASITQNKALVDNASALERLRNNRDFKQVIAKGYFEQEAVRLVHLKADPSQKSDASQASIVKQLDAIGSLSQYLQDILMLASMGAKGIQADEEMREALMEEEGEL